MVTPEEYAELVRSTRSCRRFDESAPVAQETLVHLVDVARLCSCGANSQVLRYHVVSDAVERDVVFSHLRWAAALPEWDGPEPGERPAGYIVVCAKAPIKPLRQVDLGIAATTILQAATAQGLGGCMFKAITPGLVADLSLSDEYEVALVIALGVPAERIVIDPVSEDGSTSYWRDADGTHHVPKRSLDDVLI